MPRNVVKLEVRKYLVIWTNVRKVDEGVNS